MGEEEAGSEEPDVGLDPITPGSRPEPKADTQPLCHPGALSFHFLDVMYYLQQKVFNFDEAQFIYFFLLLLMILLFYIRNHLLTQGYKNLLLCKLRVL